MMKIIDFEAKGNVIRFWLGRIDCDDYYGDDWDDIPYEHNAGTVYDEFISDYIDYVFPFSALVLEPAGDWHYNGNSPYCKDDMKNRRCPCIVVVGKKLVDENWEDYYSYWAASDADGVIKFYFGDLIDQPDGSPGGHIRFIDIA